MSAFKLSRLNFIRYVAAIFAATTVKPVAGIAKAAIESEFVFDLAFPVWFSAIPIAGTSQTENKTYLPLVGGKQ